MRLALDADVCIYAVNETPWTQAVRRAITEADELVGSVLLPAEVLAKPMRAGSSTEYEAVMQLLRGVRLVEAGLPVVALATTVAAEHGLRAVDAVHLASALHARADAFLTNNTSDFAHVRLDGLRIRFPDAAKSDRPRTGPETTGRT